MRRVGVIVAVSVLVLVMSVASWAAQSFQGGLRGSVKDAEGIIPGVTLIITNQETGVARETVSNETGEYSFPGVTPGIYSVKASVTGFKAFERRDIRIGT